MSTLLWIEHDGQAIHPATSNLISAANELSGPRVALILGQNLEPLVKQLVSFDGIDEVLSIESEAYYPFRPEPLAKVIAHYAKDYPYLMAVSTTHAQNILPRTAALLDRYMLSDVIEILAQDTFVRPIYAGNALAKQKLNASHVVMTVRASAFPKVKQGNKSVPMRSLESLADDHRSQVLSVAKPDASMPDLQTARIVVSGGRGFGDAEKFKAVEALATILGAGVGATRAAVDAGFISNDHQVGQTGKIVAPELYLAIGISGAIQHLAGMKDAKTIVAINKDPDAPIFEIASYGLVGDLFTIVPQMMEELSKLNN